MAHNSNLKKQLRRCTSAHINLFVYYMATNKDFANSVGEYSGVLGAKKSNAKWEALREELKQHGADKTVLQWKQTWRDLKRKARRAVSENQVQVPNVIFKVLKIIGPVNQDCTMEIKTTASSPSEGCDWELESEENSLMENEIENEVHIDKESNKSSEPEIEDTDTDHRNSVVEIIVPTPQIKEVFSTGLSNKALHDPLQAPVLARMPRLPRLAPKPPQRLISGYGENVTLYSPYPRLASPTECASRSPSVTHRRQILSTRRKKAQNMFQQTSNDFVSLEQRRLRMEEERDKRLHEREMERLKLELQRIEVQRNHNDLLQHLVNIVQNAYELLQQKLQ